MSDTTSIAPDLRLASSGVAAFSREAASPPDPALADLAHEFEALMMLQMLRQMRQSTLVDDESGGLGAGTMTDTIDLSLGQALSRSGGFGLAQWLTEALVRQHESAFAKPEAEFVAAGTATAPAATAPALPLPLSAPLTSAYGWRQDPFGAGTRFHSGVDFGAAYGRVVPAAGDGRVVIAGEQGGYGLTVVVDHGNGLTTRYAHLSAIDVAAGDGVATGTVVGRVGQSGRATGPHLHFEVREDGKAIDPVVAAARFGEWLKVAGGNADLPNSRSLAGPAGGAEDAY